METKERIPVFHLDGKGAPKLIEAYFEFNHLKQLYRQGWLRFVPREKCESVADHSFGVAILSLFLVGEFFPELDSSKVVKIALLHEFGEIYAGDITPHNGISIEDKRKVEKRSIVNVFSKLAKGEKYLELWEEFEMQSSPEAKLVKQVDQLEMVLQASVYEYQGYGSLQEFFDHIKERLSDPQLRKFFQELKLARKEN